jgi:hypothetical protein
MAEGKPFIYIPTYATIIIFVIMVLSLVFEIFIFANIYSFESITIGDTVYLKGEQEYTEALKKLKNILVILTSTSLILATLFGYFSFKRIRNRQP